MIAAGVHAFRHEELDLTTGLVIGDDTCLVIDTPVHGEELRRQIRKITAKPWQVVYTHNHFDHCYGTSAFLPCDVWAHENFRFDQEEQAVWARRYRDEGKPEMATAVEESELVAPTKTFAERAEIDLGGRTVVLHHFGPGHSFCDTVIEVPDTATVFAGDLVEHPAFIEESFGDGDITQWPAALERLLALNPDVVVPGHGSPTDKDFVARAREVLIAGWTSTP
ncbi:MBL fold metallo-hydrolase [Kibdelosporangium philippinense]|uniref:MBL fold metallo-hydrolase n=1 Tax=Kibdelosporangium philippinense TaxID=211113 RepID=A0ABS8ZI67_9PSEU|nr:MBL fold metallo-hydrolase [Kibdelosporangium philippinense]MCE7007504.1 MBL fold metallo-hydrolase [Kibdelosporangium philippinense]